MPRPDLTRRQRAAPPINRYSLRRGLSAGGYDTMNPLTLAVGMENDLARYPGTVYDTGVQRGRQPFYSATLYRPAGDGWVNWTEAGPPRAELHMSTTEWRHEQGGTRYPFIADSPTNGRHTMVPNGVSRTVQRYVGGEVPQMTGARINRLAAARYAGQSYSQTTAVQGRAVKR